MGRYSSRLTLRQRQALRRGEKIYSRDGQEIDKDGMPVQKEEPPSNVGDDGQYLPPGVTEVPSAEKEAANYKAEQLRVAKEEKEKRQSLITQAQSDNPNPDEGDREKSQAEIDYYAALDAGEDPKITQDHLDEIGVGEGGEGLTELDVGAAQEVSADEEPEEMPGFTSEHNPYIDPLTGEKKFQTREEWSASIRPDYSTGEGKGVMRAGGTVPQKVALRRLIPEKKNAKSLISNRR